MITRWFWCVYRWFWWRLPGHQERWLKLIKAGAAENRWSSVLKHVSDGAWIERLEREANNGNP